MHTDVHTGLANITDGGALHHVPHGESFDGLIFGHTTRAVRATDWVDMTTSLLVTTIISSLFRLWDKRSVTGDGQAHPSTIVASIVKIIRSGPLRCKTYSREMACMACEDRILTIVGNEEDGDCYRDGRKLC